MQKKKVGGGGGGGGGGVLVRGGRGLVGCWVGVGGGVGEVN